MRITIPRVVCLFFNIYIVSSSFAYTFFQAEEADVKVQFEEHLRNIEKLPSGHLLLEKLERLLFDKQKVRIVRSTNGKTYFQGVKIDPSNTLQQGSLYISTPAPSLIGCPCSFRDRRIESDHSLLAYRFNPRTLLFGCCS